MSQDTCARCPETSHTVELRGLEPLTPTLPGVGKLPEQARCHDAGPVVYVAGAGAVVSVVVKSVVRTPPRCPRRPERPGCVSTSKYRISPGKYRVSRTTPAPRSTGENTDQTALSAAGGI